MDIQFVILGLLSWRPFSGYDLKKIISESDLFYWSGNNNQIYNSLVHLHQNGLVAQQVHQQESLPPKKIYTITESGREALQRWARSAPVLPDLRNHFLIQLAWSEGLADEEVDGLLGRYEDEIAVQLRMRQVRAGAQAAAPERSARESYLWRMISENMLSQLERELEWVRRVRRGLKSGENTNGVDEPGRQDQ